MDDLARVLRASITLGAGLVVATACRGERGAESAGEAESAEVVCLPPLGASAPALFAPPFDRCPAPPPPTSFSLGFSPERTREARARDPDACCYTKSYKPMGRPLRVGGVPVLAPSRRGGTYLVAELSTALRGVDGPLRSAVAPHYEEAARVEHSSVAAFARLALDLAAIDAPATLVASARRAAREELVHARAMYTLASAAYGAPIEPAPLEAPRPGSTCLGRLAWETVWDGCFGETIGAAEARTAARRTDVPVLRALFERIADDEARHAAFAFRVLGYLVQEPETAAVAREATRAFERCVDARPRGAGIESLGVLAATTRDAIRRAIARGVVVPLVEDVLLSRPQ